MRARVRVYDESANKQYIQDYNFFFLNVASLKHSTGGRFASIYCSSNYFEAFGSMFSLLWQYLCVYHGKGL